MNKSYQSEAQVLYMIACGSPSEKLLPVLVSKAQEAGWRVYVIATPNGIKFLDISLIEKITGYPVRSEYKRPEDPDIFPRADALIVFPTTFNTLNKWALGISDTLALGLLCEYTGLRKPIVAAPCVRTGGGLDTHPAFKRSIRLLRKAGVHILYDPKTYPPRNLVPAEIILETLDQTIQEKSEGHH